MDEIGSLIRSMTFKIFTHCVPEILEYQIDPLYTHFLLSALFYTFTTLFPSIFSPTLILLPIKKTPLSFWVWISSL